MANTVQHKRGTTAQVNSYTGAVGEFIYNTTTKRIHAQDGATAGGIPHALVSDVDLKANASVTISAGTGLTGGGTLAANRTLALSSASIASLALADSAVQSVNGKTGSSITLTKADVGLGSVDNTSDANKPISTATQTALNAKANSAVTITAGSGLTGGGNLTANRTVALNAASIASLAKADTALQAPGGTTGQILAKNSNTTNDVAWVTSEAATAVSYGPQTLTEAQQAQARQNIQADHAYDTIAIATAATVPAYANVIRTNGYYAAGDGGGAMYKRVVSEPAHAGKVQSADGAWWELSEDAVYLEMFGAKGDWSGDHAIADGADDSDAIQNALSYISHRGGGKIKTRGGNYRITRTMFYPGNLDFDGCNGKFLMNAVAEGSAFLPENFRTYGEADQSRIHHIHFHDMTIDTFSGNNWGNLFGVAGARYVTFSRITSRWAWFHQVDAAGGWDIFIYQCISLGSRTAPWQSDQMAGPTSIAGVEADGTPIPCEPGTAVWAVTVGFWVVECEAYNSQTAAVHLHNRGTRNNYILNCRFDNNERGIWSDINGTVGATIIRGNIILRSQIANLDLRADHDGLTIEGNMLHQDGIDVDEYRNANIAPGSISVLYGPRRDVIFSNNRVTGAQKSVTIGDYDDVTCVGNVFRGAGGGAPIAIHTGQSSWGLHVFACNAIAISGNSFFACAVDTALYTHAVSILGRSISAAETISGNSFVNCYMAICTRAGGVFSITGNTTRVAAAVGQTDIAVSGGSGVVSGNVVSCPSSTQGYAISLRDGASATITGNRLWKSGANNPIYSNASSARVMNNHYTASSSILIRAVVSGTLTVVEADLTSAALSKADAAIIRYNFPAMTAL